MKVDKQGGVLRSYIVFALGRILPLTCFSVMPSAFIVLPLKINVLFIIIFIYKHSQETLFSGLSIKNNCVFPSSYCVLSQKHHEPCK